MKILESLIRQTAVMNQRSCKRASKLFVRGYIDGSERGTITGVVWSNLVRSYSVENRRLIDPTTALVASTTALRDAMRGGRTSI
jgi:hypothetical protein